jgi:hypothetical protein
VFQRRANAPVQAPQLSTVEAGRGPQRVQPGAPKSFVCIDISDSRERPLVEERRLE